MKIDFSVIFHKSQLQTDSSKNEEETQTKKKKTTLLYGHKMPYRLESIVRLETPPSSSVASSKRRYSQPWVSKE